MQAVPSGRYAEASSITLSGAKAARGLGVAGFTAGC